MFSAIIKQFINNSYTHISHIRDTFISIHKPYNQWGALQLPPHLHWCWWGQGGVEFLLPPCSSKWCKSALCFLPPGCQQAQQELSLHFHLKATAWCAPLSPRRGNRAEGEPSFYTPASAERPCKHSTSAEVEPSRQLNIYTHLVLVLHLHKENAC